MKFLADMGISPVTVEWLNKHGHDAKHLFEEKLHRLTDREIFEKAQNENCIVLTTDLDFGEIATSTPSSKISVIIFRQQDRTPPSINKHLENVITTANSELKRGAINNSPRGEIPYPVSTKRLGFLFMVNHCLINKEQRRYSNEEVI